MKTNTIGAKGLMAFVVVLILTMIASGYSSISSIRSLRGRFNVAVDKSARKIELGGKLDTIKSDMYLAQVRMLVAALMKDPERAALLRREFDGQTAALNVTMEEIRPLMVVPEGKRLLALIETDFNAWFPEYREVVRLCDAGDPRAAQLYSYQKVGPIYERISANAAHFTDTYREALQEDKQAAADQYTTSLWLAIALSLISMACIGVGGYMVAAIYKSIKLAAAELAEGAEQVASAAGQISSSSQSLAQGASEQASSLEETSASSEEMSSMTRKNAENSQHAAKLMHAVSQRVIEANRTLADMTTSMGEIGASSGKISKIIKVIDEIAFQTNILALNAAVEAARAGEAGMGFAVVADEVRNLAQRSAQAAKDTATLIEDSIQKSTEGSKKLGEVAVSIQAITEGAGQVKTLVDEVEASSKEQTQGIEQISKAVAEMDTVTQRTAANAEESASASEELSAQSQALMSVVDRLQTLVGSASGNSPTVRKPAFAKHISAARPAETRVSLAPVRKPVAVLTGAPSRRAPEFPLDDSEFKEF